MANEKKIDYVLLGLLCHESLTGYEIKKRLDTRLSLFWNASYGSIYPALAKLEEAGYVIKEKPGDSGREKIIYSITESGREYLKKWLAVPVTKDELRYETLLKLFFGHEVGSEITLEHISAFEDKIRKELPFLKEAVNQLNAASSDETHKYYMLTASFGVETYETYLRWCEQAKKLLSEGGKF